MKEHQRVPVADAGSDPPGVQFLGLHLHSDDVSGYSHAHDDHEEGPPEHIYKMLVVMAGIYSFYLMETIFSLVANGHQHSHEEVGMTRHRPLAINEFDFKGAIRDFQHFQALVVDRLASCAGLCVSCPPPISRSNLPIFR